MRSITVESFGSPDVLHFCEVPDPVPPPGGYLVKVMAAAVNYADTVERRGAYRKGATTPLFPGKEAAGVVIARHPAATEFDVGERVIVIRFANGCYAEMVAAAGHEVLRPPRDLTFVEMAGFGTSFLTAWYAMHEIARVRRDESVLIQAAAGGVGSAAVLLARAGSERLVIGAAGGREKCRLVEALGADVSIDYTGEDLGAAVRRATGGRGVDYCLESVGGDVYDHSLEVIAAMGRLVLIGFSSVRDDYASALRRIHPLTLFHRSITVGGLNVDQLGVTKRRDVWSDLVRYADDHGLRPVIGSVLPWEEVRTAHARMESRSTMGKVVLAVDGDLRDARPAPVASGAQM